MRDGTYAANFFRSESSYPDDATLVRLKYTAWQHTSEDFCKIQHGNMQQQNNKNNNKNLPLFLPPDITSIEEPLLRQSKFPGLHFSAILLASEIVVSCEESLNKNL